MQITRNDDLEAELLTEMWEAMQTPSRAEQKPSVTGLLYCLTKEYYEWQRKDDPPPDRDTILLFATGLAIEKVLLAGRQVPTEGQLDGIWYHTDHFGKGPPLEVKSTRLTMRTAPDNIPLRWHRQFMSYLKAHDQIAGDFTVLYMAGDYGKRRLPELMCWHVEYTREEVDENWSWFLERKDIQARFRQSGETPAPFTYNEEWECGYCWAKLICDARSTGNEPHRPE